VLALRGGGGGQSHIDHTDWSILGCITIKANFSSCFNDYVFNFNVSALTSTGCSSSINVALGSHILKVFDGVNIIVMVLKSRLNIL
jgi:hypothetical protein